jgi:hypothetical protein
LVIVSRPFVVMTRTGLATLAVAGALTLVVDTVVPVRVAVGVAPVREELVAARAGDPEMLAGGLTTAAAVGDNVRTLAKPVGAETALLVGVMTLDGAITGAAAFVTFVLGLAVVVVPVTTADEPAIVDAAVKPVLPAPVVSTTFAATLLVASGSPAPLRMASVGPE